MLGVLAGALDLLRSKQPAGTTEPELNRELFLCILEVNRRNRDAGRDEWFDYPPAYEARNPPTPETEDSASEKKIPDLYWGYLDHDESDPRRSSRNFVIECKRLGTASAAGWEFNVHYVEDGILRFRHSDWRYGKDVQSGAMVGYIQSMAVDEVLADINSVSVTHGITPITPNEPLTPALHVLTHVFDRSFEVSPFRLLHFWLQMAG